MKTAKTLDLVNVATDLVFLSLLLLQQISNKSQEEVIAAIQAEGKKSKRLLELLR